MNKIINIPENDKSLNDYLTFTIESHLEYVNNKIKEVWNDDRLRREDIDYIVYKLGTIL